MSQVRTQLLASLPLYLQKSPQSEPALTVTYTVTPAALTIAHHRLRIQTGAGVAVDEELADYTLASLATALTGAGYPTTVAHLDADMSALALMDVDRVPLDPVATLYCFTAFLWRSLVAPLAWALEDTEEQLHQGILQTSTQTAEGQWLDLWGAEYYGGLLRKPGELDRPYAERIIREVLRIRLNSVAIEKILFEELGIQSDIVNLHEYAWVIQHKIQYLVGRKYSRTTFMVITTEISAEIARIVERNRAAGTLPFYEFIMTGGGVATAGGGLWASIESVTMLALIAPNLVWTVVPDALSETGLALSLPRNLESHLVAAIGLDLAAPYYITGESATIPIELDAGAGLDSSDILLP